MRPVDLLRKQQLDLVGFPLLFFFGCLLMTESIPERFLYFVSLITGAFFPLSDGLRSDRCTGTRTPQCGVLV